MNLTLFVIIFVNFLLYRFVEYEEYEESEDTRFHQLKSRTMHKKNEKDFETFESVQKTIESIASDDKFDIQCLERVEFENRYYDDHITHHKESKRGTGKKEIPKKIDAIDCSNDACK